MNRTSVILALALLAGAFSTFPQNAMADSPRPAVAVPPGWSTHEAISGDEYFLPPGATTMDVYEAVFPSVALNGSLEQTGNALWHSMLKNERVVDAKSHRIQVSDGASAYEVVVATLDTRKRGVYHVFMFKQFGHNVAAGELRFNSIERIEAIGQPAFTSLENMSLT